MPNILGIIYSIRSLNEEKGIYMKRKVLALALSMGIVFGGAGQAFADENIDKKIEAAQSELTKAEEDHKKVKDAYDEFREYNKGHINEKGEYISNGEAVKENMKNTAEKLDEMVANKVPSVEQASLQAIFATGLKDETHNIRPLNAYDLLDYVKESFEKKEGVDQAQYENAVVKYINAISDYVLYPNLAAVQGSLRDQLKESQSKVDKAKSDLRAARREKNKEKIGDLEKAMDRAQRTVDSAKLLIEKYPNTVKPIKGELERLITKQEGLIKKAKQAIEKLS